MDLTFPLFINTKIITLYIRFFRLLVGGPANSNNADSTTRSSEYSVSAANIVRTTLRRPKQKWFLTKLIFWIQITPVWPHSLFLYLYLYFTESGIKKRKKSVEAIKKLFINFMDPKFLVVGNCLEACDNKPGCLVTPRQWRTILIATHLIEINE